MKRIIVFLLLIVCVSFLAYQMTDNTNNVDVVYGNSAIFSEAELQAAVKTVMFKFREFRGCELTRIWYDEEQSEHYVEGYRSNGRGAANGVEEGNIIVLFSDFYVDASGASPSLNPDSDYTNWNWILIRESPGDKWIVDDWGY